MKRVLLIAYYAPPHPGIGALRPMGLADYLPDFGWDPVLLTARMAGKRREQLKNRYKWYEVDQFDALQFVQNPLKKGIPDQGVHFRTPELGLAGKSKINREFKSVVKSISAYPDRHNGWWLKAFTKAKQIIIDEKIDLILSTSPPWTDAVLASSLTHSTGVPWVADMRDLWSQYHMYDFGKLRLKFDQILEKRVLNRAKAIVVVSDVRAKMLSKNFPKKKIVPITLGFDPKHFAEKSVSTEEDIFTVTHVGKILRRASARNYFQALAELLDSGDVPRNYFRSHFWGPVERNQREFAERLGLSDVVEFHDLIPREQVISKELESHMLLICSWSDPSQTGVHPGKFFDYLGAKKNILAVGEHEDVITDALQKTKAGVHLFEVKEIKEHIVKAYIQFSQSGGLTYEGVEEEINRFSYPEIAGEYARLLDSLV